MPKLQARRDIGVLRAALRRHDARRAALSNVGAFG
jgi:hypothetical protein